jgi:hypothetical protein
VSTHVCREIGTGSRILEQLPPSAAPATIDGVVALRQRARLLVVGGLAVTAVPAALAAPPSAQPPRAAPPPSIVWANHVFSTRGALAAWLSARGTTYSAWARRHPADAAILEHVAARPPGAVQPPTSGGPPFAPPSGGAVAAETPGGGVPAGGSGGFVPWAQFVLLALAALTMLIAAVPAALARVLGPDWLGSTRRTYLFALGLSLCIGVLVARGRL